MGSVNNMSKEAVNILLKNDIGFSNNEDIEDYRTTYLSIINKTSEEDFYNSKNGSISTAISFYSISPKKSAVAFSFF